MTPPDPAGRREPLTAARFSLALGDTPLAGVVRVSALELTGPGIGVTVAPVTITRVVGSDDVFHAWAHETMGRGGERPTRDLVLSVHGPDGAPAAACELLGVMPLAFSPAGALDALAPDLVTETLTVSVTEVRPLERGGTRP